VTERSPISL